MADVDNITDSLPSKEEEQDETVYICRNGLKVKCKKINGRIFVDAMRKLSYPKVPTVYIEELKRDEENPNHPDYIRAVSDYNFQTEELAFNVCFALGVDVLEKPADIEPLESMKWSDEIREALELAGQTIDIPAEGNRRRVMWLKYHAIPSEDDQTEILTRVLSLGGGVVAAKVEEAIGSFRSPEERLADHGIHVIE